MNVKLLILFVLIGLQPIYGCTDPINDGDTVVVGSEDTLLIDCYYTHSNVILQVYGVLLFDVGAKLNLDCSSSIQLYEGGSIQGGNPGTKILLCGEEKWNGGDGPISGPAYVDSSTSGFAPGLLPVELVYFDGVCVGRGEVLLEWETASESNNNYFSIHKSIDAVNFNEVGTIDGAGDSYNMMYYSFVDDNVQDEVNYYILNQHDFDGTVTTSKIIIVYSKLKHSNNLVIYDLSGRVVSSMNNGLYIVNNKLMYNE